MWRLWGLYLPSRQPLRRICACAAVADPRYENIEKDRSSRYNRSFVLISTVIMSSNPTINPALLVSAPLSQRTPISPSPSNHFTLVYDPSFWVLGLFVILNGIWVKEQFDQYVEIENQYRNTSAQSPDIAHVVPGQHNLRRRWFWLQPHITSRTRQALAVLGAGLVFGPLLLELKWLGTVAYQASRVIVCNACLGVNDTVRETGLWQKLLQCLPTALIILFVWSLLLLRVVVWFFTQLSYVLQLWSLRPEDPLDLSHTSE